MSSFTFVARDTEGHQVNGVRSASNRQELIAKLRAEALIVTSVTEEFRGAGPAMSRGEKRPDLLKKLLQGRIKSSALMVFARQFAAMLKAGISLTDALHTIAHSQSNSRLREILLSIRTSVQRGQTLTDSMRRHGDVFGQLFLSMIHAGETSGSLAQNVARLAEYLEKKERFRRKLKTATAYPKFVIGFFTVLTGGIFLIIIPKFQEMFAEFGANLPTLTQVFMDLSTFLRSNLIYIVAVLVLLVVGLVLWKKTPGGAAFWSKAILKIPFFGTLFLKAAVARLAMTMSTLLNNGIPLTDSMRIAARTSNNAALEEGVRVARRDVMKGFGLAESLDKVPELPRLLPRMVRIGEESGTLSEMLGNIASYYDQEVDASLNKITSIIEPVLICGMGVVVCITVIAIYLPIFSMSQAMRG